MSRWMHALRFTRVPAGYLAVAVLATLLLAATESLIVTDAWRSRDHALESLRSDARQATDAKARELSQLLTDVYVTTRTISLLPAVRRPEPRNRLSTEDDAIDGRRFSVTDAQTVLQLYHHLAELLSVSEIYVVYDGFAPERGEVPFLMFDSVIVERIRRLTAAPGAHNAGSAAAGTAAEPEQEEGEEYAEIVRQLAQLRSRHPMLPAGAPHGVASLVSRPVITCDNSQYLSTGSGHDRDRLGVLLSVPIYAEADGALKGLVTTIVRLNVLEARLLDWPLVPVSASERQQAHQLGLDRTQPAEYVLTEAGSGIRVSDRRNAALEDIVQGRANAGLTLSKSVDGPPGQRWLLTRHVPQASFDTIDAAARRAIAVRSAIALAVLGALAGIALLMVAQRRATAKLQEMADFDPLTGLPNRRHIDRRLDAALQAATTSPRPLSLVMIDLDNFKTVNDTHGHHVGDLLLTEVARRLQKQLGTVDEAVTAEAADTAPLVGRLGGDEFLVLLPQIDDEAAACAVAERLLAALAVPAIVDGHAIQVRASLGVALYPDHGRSAAQLLRACDQAMYSAKRVDGSAVVTFEREVDHAAVRRARLTADLREALVHGQFALHYQTVVDVLRVRADAAEALLRWQHPEFGPVSPAEFVPLLERSGLIVPVGLWALRRACEQLLEWQAAGSTIASVAVNASVVQLARSDFCDDALEVIAATGVEPRCVTIEVTESVLMDNPERCIEQLQRLRQAGVRIAIDDFGAGYSSLGYLRRLPVQVMKIDRSLLIDAVSPTGRAILAAMVELAGELGLDCIAEGVETLEQYKLLLDVGCHRLQGYLFARPLPAADAAAAAQRLRGHGGFFTDSFFAGLERRSGFATLDG
ncbi:MAG: EAL domain-containing protein [Piscinibacter sp.]